MFKSSICILKVHLLKENNIHVGTECDRHGQSMSSKCVHIPALTLFPELLILSMLNSPEDETKTDCDSDVVVYI
ncbi:unnamed protein product [Cuscuta campestris]|uniref:Uncharacterized protein n=1 Tax=Cuscuta campestris TaxID=132261 RepID=A0A484MLU9_9ASTE|nr:unnamed protein product [Cuscuta campestris]